MEKGGNGEGEVSKGREKGRTGEGELSKGREREGKVRVSKEKAIEK